MAHVGATERQLMDLETSFELYRFPYSKIDKAVTDDRTRGWIKVLATRNSGKILGVNILGERAGDQIAHFALAMQNGITLKQMADPTGFIRVRSFFSNSQPQYSSQS